MSMMAVSTVALGVWEAAEPAVGVRVRTVAHQNVPFGPGFGLKTRFSA